MKGILSPHSSLPLNIRSEESQLPYCKHTQQPDGQSHTMILWTAGKELKPLDKSVWVSLEEDPPSPGKSFYGKTGATTTQLSCFQILDSPTLKKNVVLSRRVWEWFVKQQEINNRID